MSHLPGQSSDSKLPMILVVVYSLKWFHLSHKLSSSSCNFFFGHAGHKQSTAGSPSFHFTTPGPVYRCRVDTQRTAARTLRGPQSRDFKYVKRKKNILIFYDSHQVFINCMILWKLKSWLRFIFIVCLQCVYLVQVVPSISSSFFNRVPGS